MASSHSPHPVPHGAHVLVCDARRGLLFVNEGSPVAPRLALVHADDAPANPPAREQGSDRPGRVLASADRRSAVEQTDLHAAAEAAFASRLADEVAGHAAQGTLSALVLVAPPHMLAALRHAMAPDLHRRVVAEIAADLTKQPVEAIAACLSTG